MKRINNAFIILLIAFALFYASCSTPRMAMIDASVPPEGQSLIVVVNATGDWSDITLTHVDDTQYNIFGSMFYIPSGTRTLGFNRTTTVSESDYSRRDSIMVTTTTINAQLTMTDQFLPEHTYRITRRGTNLIMEDITGGVDWVPPRASPVSPNDGILTNFARPRGFYLTFPFLYYGVFGEYSSLPGKDALSLVNNQYVFIFEKGYTGLNLVNFGANAQAGFEVGYNQFGLTLLAELNGGAGFGGNKYEEASIFNLGFNFMAELYLHNLIGVGFGYGRTRTAYSIFSTFMREDTAYLLAYDNKYPFYRFEILFLRSKLPVTLYGDYFSQHESWRAGIRMNFGPRRIRFFNGQFLQ